jgi:anti-sigma factor RsiW
MNCKKAQQWISRDLDGELGARRKSRLDAHISTCAACRELREQWGRVGAQLRETLPVAAQTPEAAWADVRRSIRVSRKEKELWPAWVLVPSVRWATAAALLMLVTLFGLRTRQMAPVEGTTVELVETDLPGAAPMVYEDAGSGLTVIWVVESNGKEGDHAGS